MSKFRLLLDQGSHFLTAKTRHGVHSPFVYRLVDEVIYDFSPKKTDEGICDIHYLRKNEYRFSKQSAITFGGRMLPLRAIKLIGRLLVHFQPKSIINIGAKSGIMPYVPHFLPCARLITLSSEKHNSDPADLNFAMVETHMERQGNSLNTLLLTLKQEKITLDLLFFNQDLQGWDTLTCFYACMPYIQTHSILIIEGIYQGKKMKQAWEEIKNNTLVSVTIDLFHIGLVFFKTDQEKEQFKIRFL